MNPSERLQDSLSTLSRTSAILFVAIEAVSIYLWQRATATIVTLPQAVAQPIEMLGPESYPFPQIDYYGLRFSYRTMTILWPVVLGCLCFAFSHVAEKQRAVWNLLQDLATVPQEQLLAMLPYAPLATSRPAVPWVPWILLMYLPFSGLTLHFMASGVFGISVMSRWYLSHEVAVVLSGMSVLIMTTGVGFLGVWGFPRSLRILRTMFTSP